MGQKLHNKHAAKKSTTDLFPSSAGVKAIDSPWATASQLHPYTGLDEPTLRRRARETNPATGKPWIPAPSGARFQVWPTLRGLCAWREHHAAAATTRGLPAQCSSMKATEAATGITVESQQYLRKKNLCPDAFDASNRVNLLPLIRALATQHDQWRKYLTGQGTDHTGLEGFEELDLDHQRARVAKADADERERNNRLADGHLQTRTGVEETVWERGLLPLRGELLNLPKTLRAEAGLSPEQHQALSHRLQHILNKIAQAIPSKSDEQDELTTPRPSTTEKA